MADYDLKRLRRQDLLELLLEARRENERMSREAEELRTKCESRDVILENAGSIAEAALQLNGVFTAAQQAADQYVYNMKRLAEEQAGEVARLQQENAALRAALDARMEEEKARLQAAAGSDGISGTAAAPGSGAEADSMAGTDPAEDPGPESTEPYDTDNIDNIDNIEGTDREADGSV